MVTPRSGRLVAALLALVSCLLAGCGSSTDPGPGTDRGYPSSRARWEPALRLPPASGERVAITPRAMAAIMLSVLPGGTEERYGARYPATRRDPAYLAASLTWRDFPGAPDADPAHDLGDDDAWTLDLVLEPPTGTAAPGCVNRCADLGRFHGQRVTLDWLAKAAEGDEGAADADGPGVLSLRTTRPDGWTVSVAPPFDDVADDPRTQRLTIGLATLARLITDPRLGPTTDAALVRYARTLPGWVRSPYLPSPN